MPVGDGSRISFIAEYYDPQASLTRSYQLFYCPSDSTVEMHDLKNRRIFLKRCPIQNLSPKEVFLGATITVFGRQLHLVEYGDQHTRTVLQNTEEEAFAQLSGAKATAQLGRVLTAINNKGLRIGHLLLQRQNQTIYLSAKGANAVEIIKSLEAVYPFLVSLTNPSPSAFVLAPRPQSQTPKQTTIALIKPHAILSGDAGAIVQRIIDDGFEIVSLNAVNLGQCDAEDFFEVYKGVVPEYQKLVEHVASGPSWVLELRSPDNTVAAFRSLCGPHDPEICKVLFPTSIRAQYGIDRVKNAIHCTDLPEESLLESEFFFTLFPSKP